MSKTGMVYGNNFSKSDVANYMNNYYRDYYGNKSYETINTNIDSSANAAISQLSKNYSSEMNAAYNTYLQESNVVDSSNLISGQKDLLKDELNLALAEAYESYRNSYLTGVADIESAAAQQTQAVTDALTEQAEYVRDFANAPYQYLQYVFEQYGEGNKSENIFYNEEMWKRYTNELTDEKGNLTGERELKSWEEIVNYGANEEITDKFGNTQKQWIGLYDDQGNLTIKGADFFDQMINQLAYEGRGISFGQWLAENNQELYDWSQSYNPYDYTEAGSNLGSFKTMVGLTSTDEKYTFMERFGGLSKSEVDKMYSGFANKLTELDNKIMQSSGRNVKEITNEFTSLTAEIGKLTDQLGITADVENELGMSLDDLGNYLANNASNAVSNGDIWWQGILATGSAIGTGTVIGAKAGGGWGALAGAIVGTIVGVISGVSGSEKTKAQNKALAQASRDAYDDLVTTLITYSQNKQRQAQIDYYKK